MQYGSSTALLRNHARQRLLLARYLARYHAVTMLVFTSYNPGQDNPMGLRRPLDTYYLVYAVACANYCALL